MSEEIKRAMTALSPAKLAEIVACYEQRGGPAPGFVNWLRNYPAYFELLIDECRRWLSEPAGDATLDFLSSLMRQVSHLGTKKSLAAAIASHSRLARANAELTRERDDGATLIHLLRERALAAERRNADLARRVEAAQRVIDATRLLPGATPHVVRNALTDYDAFILTQEPRAP